MQGVIRCALVAGLVCACHADDTTTPADGDVGGDGGLTVRWSSRPMDWPGDLGSKVTLESARFALDSLRVIGDAGPGDLRTTKDAFEVRWAQSEAPGDIMFESAPTGLYSQLALQIDGNLVEDSYELRGTVVVNNNDEDFVIEDSEPLPINLSIDKSLSAGARSTIDIEIDFDHAISAVDFSMLNKSDGKLQLDEGDPQIVELRKKLGEAFKTPNIAPH